MHRDTPGGLALRDPLGAKIETQNRPSGAKGAPKIQMPPPVRACYVQRLSVQFVLMYFGRPLADFWCPFGTVLVPISFFCNIKNSLPPDSARFCQYLHQWPASKVSAVAPNHNRTQNRPSGAKRIPTASFQEIICSV